MRKTITVDGKEVTVRTGIEGPKEKDSWKIERKQKRKEKISEKQSFLAENESDSE